VSSACPTTGTSAPCVACVVRPGEGHVSPLSDCPHTAPLHLAPAGPPLQPTAAKVGE